jgi:hypothetical protein
MPHPKGYVAQTCFEMSEWWFFEPTALAAGLRFARLSALTPRLSGVRPLLKPFSDVLQSG